MDDFSGEFFSVDLQIAVKPGALRAPDIQLLEDQIYNLVFSYNSFGLINLGKSAYFYLTVKSVRGGLIYETHRYRFDSQTLSVLWDEREVWFDMNEEYIIEFGLDERCGKTLDFWHWLESSTSSFWENIELKGFLHCDSEPHASQLWKAAKR